MNTEDLIIEVTKEMRDLLITKNRAYGDSATNPSNVFSKGSPIDSLCARIDDKLMRIQNKGINDNTEDTVSDLIGYLILLKVAMRKEKGDEYNILKDTISDGGHVSMNGHVMSTIEDLNIFYDNNENLDEE